MLRRFLGQNPVEELANGELANRPIISISSLELLMTEGNFWEDILTSEVSLENLIWLHSRGFPFDSLSPWIPMERLSVLNVGRNEKGTSLKRLWGDDNFEVPLQLRQLVIRTALLEFPKSIGQLKYLEKIAVGYAVFDGLPRPLKTLPDEFCDLQCLQHLEIIGYSNMESLPESFGNLKNLRHLQLDHCSNLRALPNSCGKLIRLKHLSLYWCDSLTMSSEALGNITTLEYIDMRHCRHIKELPRQVAHQQNLSQLFLDATGIKELPGAITDLRALEILSIPPLEMLPAWVGCLRSLKYLSIFNLANLKCLPDSMRELTKLENLSIAYSGVECLPPWIMELNNLVWLSVQECPLRELPFNTLGGERATGGNSIECMLGLRDLTLCSTMTTAVAFGRGICPNLERLDISSCPRLAEIRALPNSLLEVKLWHCHQLEKIDGLCGLAKLKTLKIRYSPRLKELSGLGTLTSLESLHLHKCGVAGIPDLQPLTKLRALKVTKCPALEELEGIEHSISLHCRFHNLRCDEDLRPAEEYPSELDDVSGVTFVSADTYQSDDEASHETYPSNDTAESTPAHWISEFWRRFRRICGCVG